MEQLQVDGLRVEAVVGGLDGLFVAGEEPADGVFVHGGESVAGMRPF